MRRVVGFNIGSHSTLKEYEESKTAVVLKNTKENKNSEIIFNQQSNVQVAQAFDVDFDYVSTTNASKPASMPRCNNYYFEGRC